MRRLRSTLARGEREKVSSTILKSPKVIRFLPNFVKSFGVYKGVLTFLNIYALPRREDDIIRVSQNKRALYLRNTSSDTSIYFQIFIKNEYETNEWPQHKWLVKKYSDIIKRSKVPLILDIGGNIGLATRWFKERFPDSRIITIEPDEANFAILKKNVCALDHVTALKGAVWDRRERLRIENPSAGAGALRVSTGDGDLEVFLIPDLVRNSANAELFIVKIDVEGAEKQIFRSNNEWLETTDLVIVELHDWLYPAQNTSRTFLGAVSSMDVDVLFRGENIFCFFGVE